MKKNKKIYQIIVSLVAIIQVNNKINKIYSNKINFQIYLIKITIIVLLQIWKNRILELLLNKYINFFILFFYHFYKNKKKNFY